LLPGGREAQVLLQQRGAWADAAAGSASSVNVITRSTSALLDSFPAEECQNSLGNCGYEFT